MTMEIGTVTFQRELGSPLRLKDVMFILGLTKNLIFVAVLENRGYDVIFSKGKVFLRHIATGQVKEISVRVKNMYKIEVGECVAFRSKEWIRDIVVEREHDLALKMEPQPVGSWADHDDDDDDHPETSSRGRVQAKWAQGAHAIIPLGLR